MDMIDKNSVLVVDDNREMRDLLSAILDRVGYQTKSMEDGNSALAELSKACWDVIILDLKLPGMDGLTILEKIRENCEFSNVIMLTGNGAVNDAVRAMKLGAFDFITKPFECEELLMVVKRACENSSMRRELKMLRAQLEDQREAHKVLGKSEAIQRVLKQVRLVAPTTMTVILQGESGAGKEVIANMIHRMSRRYDKPFVPVDCGAIPEQLTESILFGHEKGAFTGADSAREGQFERAHEGTIFLDEIVNTSQSTQAKMLRVVQEKKLRHLGGKKDIDVDVRIITASNVNLRDAVNAGKLRADLYHRLNEFVINVPPLRERREDIPVLAQQFLLEANNEMQKNVAGFSSEAMKLLLNTGWSGNVRELKNVVKKAVLMAEGDMIRPVDVILDEIVRSAAEFLPAAAGKGVSIKAAADTSRENLEKEIISRALAEAGGNKAKAARILKIDRGTLYAKIGKYKC